MRQSEWWNALALLLEQTYYFLFCTVLQQNTHSILLFCQECFVPKMTHCTPACTDSLLWVDFIPPWDFHSQLLFGAVTGFSFCNVYLEYVRYVLLASVFSLETCQTHHTSAMSISHSTLQNGVAIFLTFFLSQAVSHLNPSSWECCLMMWLCKSTPRSFKAEQNHLTMNMIYRLKPLQTCTCLWLINDTDSISVVHISLKFWSSELWIILTWWHFEIWSFLSLTVEKLILNGTDYFGL